VDRGGLVQQSVLLLRFDDDIKEGKLLPKFWYEADDSHSWTVDRVLYYKRYSSFPR